MSDCQANTVTDTQDPGDIAGADYIQGVINRLKTYWDKYNVSNIRTTKRIGYTYTRYDRSTAGIEYDTKVLASLMTDIKATMNNYKDKYDNSGGDFVWLSLVQNNDHMDAAQGDQLRVRLLSLESQCWACHTGDTSPTCTHCHSSADSCSTGDNCSCYSTCHSEGCTCHHFCYGTSCQCDASTTYSYSCICHNASHGAGVYTYTAFCTCNNAEYGLTCTCYTTCYNEHVCIAGYSATECYGFTCSCNSSCYGHSCTCHEACHDYNENCTQCYGTTY